MDGFGSRAEDRFLIEAIGDLQTSPDGAVAAFVRQEMDLEGNESRTSIWVVPTDGSEAPRRLTGGRGDRNPRWSPAGDRIAFLSDRAGKPQLYVIDVAGGEARRVETDANPAQPPRWSPDGSRIAFVAQVEVPPEGPRHPGEPESLRPKKDGGKDPGGPRIRVIADYDYRFDGRGFFDDRYAHVHVVAVDGATDGAAADGDPPAEGGSEGKRPTRERRLTEGRFTHDEPCWLPDGRTLLVRAHRERGLNLEGAADIWQVDADGGTPITCFLPWDGVIQSGPQVSPDGRHVAFTGMKHGAPHWVQPAGLWVVPLEAPSADARLAAARDLTAGLDRPVGGSIPCEIRYGMLTRAFEWRGGDRLRFLCGNEGRALLHEVGIHGGAAEPIPTVHELPAGPGASAAARSAAAAVTAALAGTPPRQAPTANSGAAAAARTVPDLPVIATFSGDAGLAGGPARPEQIFARGRRLTAFNAAAEAAALPVERFRVTSEPGWSVDGWLMRPADYMPGRRYPTILSIHGGPTGAYGDTYSFTFQAMARQGYAVLYCNPRGSTTYGERFQSGVVGDWGGGDYRDIMACVDHAIALGVADPERLGVTGWSYGGYMTSWIITQTDRFKAAVAGALISNLVTLYGVSDIGIRSLEHLVGGPAFENEEAYMARSAIRHAARIRTPTLILHGDADMRCPLDQAEQLFTALQRRGVPSAMVRYPGEYHGLQKPRHLHDRLARTLGWFDHWLKR